MAGPGPAPPRLALAVAALAALVAVKYYQDAEAARRQELALKSLGNEGLFLFSSLDTNNDLYLSPEEFKPIAEKLTGVAPISEFEEEEMPDPSRETLSILAKFQPLVMETMTKSKDGFLGISHVALSGLRNWTAPAAPMSVLLARQFKAFLPPKNKLDLGDPWWIIPSELNIFTGYLSNNRFYPPPPKGKEVIIHKLLSMFHPRPFVKTRFAPQGAVACIQAISSFYYTIAFRIHAEFQLNEPPDFPFWFSPGQFTGHIILSKDASHVREFKLFVPNNRSLNVDMEWLYGASESRNMEVDIGYLPQAGGEDEELNLGSEPINNSGSEFGNYMRFVYCFVVISALRTGNMELESTGPSIPTVIHDENGNIIDSRDPSAEPIQFVFEEITWQQEIPWEEAAQKLEVAMYPFKKISYLPFTEAFERAKAEKKLVHSILLWGALDDQSC
ncbi:Selenoprotein N [Willisornis vidua]|uniref:Selenoprotein N n=1 Tax=Willisornis vidua TaxID=1566151 RepID=A0ABQ9CVI6_9PASS|nr:Selenoprotein N [Willisornis vidua]